MPRTRIPAVLAAPLLCLPLAATSGPTALMARERPHRDPAPAARSEPDLARPLAWLVAAQNTDGSWGEEAHSQSPDVATTSLAGIALLRTGHGGPRGDLRSNVERAVEYVVTAVERAPADQISVQGPGTLPQRKLGRNIDTYVAAQFLSEALPTLPRQMRGRAETALGDCVRRIERAQGADGSFAKDGWAPLLSSAFAANGLHAAAAAGAAVDAKKLARADANLMGKYDERAGTFDSSESAGVHLYSAAASVVAAARVQEAQPGTPLAARELQLKAKAVERGAAPQLSNEQLLRGFGSYGGEEHVSYMLVAEAKALAGGDEFAAWSKQMRARLAGIQRENGTWRGDHCITSTTFCTAASLITLAVRPHQGSGKPS
jgi:hypothetical protein